jgi:hypothetical protein
MVLLAPLQLLPYRWNELRWLPSDDVDTYGGF